MAQTLFVGGVADGQRMNVADDENNVYIAHPLPPLTYKDNIPDSFELPQVDYYLHSSKGGALMTREYYRAMEKCVARYRDMMYPFKPEDEELYKFLIQLKMGLQNRMPLMKLNRWLGYIQGCLIERGYTTVQAERDWTRPYFRPLDYDNLLHP